MLISGIEIADCRLDSRRKGSQELRKQYNACDCNGKLADLFCTYVHGNDHIAGLEEDQGSHRIQKRIYSVS